MFASSLRSPRRSCRREIPRISGNEAVAIAASRRPHLAGKNCSTAVSDHGASDSCTRGALQELCVNKFQAKMNRRGTTRLAPSFRGHRRERTRGRVLALKPRGSVASERTAAVIITVQRGGEHGFADEDRAADC